MGTHRKSKREFQVVVLDDIDSRWAQTTAIAKLHSIADVRIFTDTAPSYAALVRRLRGARIVIANRERTRFTAGLFRDLPELELLCNTGAHAAPIDRAAAKAAGVKVLLAPGANPAVSGRSTAELTVALMQAVMRRIPQSDREVRAGKWRPPVGEVLYGKTLAIVGLGRVGSKVARLANAFGMKVLAWSPTLTAARARRSGAEYRDFDRMLAEADVVTIHVSLDEETRGLIDARRLALLKPTAYLVNTSRGAILDERALVDALKQNRIAGAALDVFDREPLPRNHPLTKLNNVVLTPHIGWPADLTYQEFAGDCTQKILRYISRRRSIK
jgi:phosphoglycerate dehydrogenase-like enzyme